VPKRPKVGSSGPLFWDPIFFCARSAFAGLEVQVLAATDFAKIEVGVLSIEWAHVDHKEVDRIMVANGFVQIGRTFLSDIVRTWKGDLDVVYVNPAYFKKRGLTVPHVLDKSCTRGNSSGSMKADGCDPLTVLAAVL
jgi:hypothetical protein